MPGQTESKESFSIFFHTNLALPRCSTMGSHDRLHQRQQMMSMTNSRVYPNYQGWTRLESGRWVASSDLLQGVPIRIADLRSCCWSAFLKRPPPALYCVGQTLKSPQGAMPLCFARLSVRFITSLNAGHSLQNISQRRSRTFAVGSDSSFEPFRMMRYAFLTLLVILLIRALRGQSSRVPLSLAQSQRSAMLYFCWCATRRYFYVFTWSDFPLTYLVLLTCFAEPMYPSVACIFQRYKVPQAAKEQLNT